MVVKAFGIMFFTLLLLAGISSSVSLVEAPISALIDKFKAPRRKIIPFVGLVGILGSAAFALPTVIDPSLSATGTLGLTLLDLTDHWAFSYGLLIGGLTECILLGWFFGPEKLRAHINKHSRMHLPAIFDVLIKYIIPAILIFILTSSALQEFKVLYGSDYPIGQWANILPILCFLVWALGGVLLSLLLTLRGNYDEEVQA